MVAQLRTTLLLLLAALTAVAGTVEAVRGRNWDLTTVFVAVVLLQLAAIGAARVGRRPVGLRADLASWIDQHAAATGEPPTRVVDRCVATYRAGLTTDSEGRP